MKAYWKQNRVLILLFTVFVFAAEGILLYVGMLNGKLVDLATGAASTGKDGFGVLFGLFLLLGILSMLMPICFYLYTLFTQFFRVRIQSAMRRDLFRSVLHRSYRSYLQKEEGVYLSAYTSQVDSLDISYFRAIHGILQIVASAVFALIFLYFIHPPFVLYSIVGAVPALLIPRLIEPLINRLQKQNLELVSRNIATLNEYLSGIHTILLFNRRGVFQRFFQNETDEIRSVAEKIPLYMNLATNLSHLLLNLYYVAIVLLSSIEIAKGNISVGSYVAALHILSDVTSGLGFTVHYLQQFAVSRKTVEHILEAADSCEPCVMEESEKRRVEGEIESIGFDRVHFSFDGATDIIDGFDRTFREKGVYEIVGASGSGKSTLLNLLCGYIRPRSGSAEINGVSVSRVENLNDLFTIMRQDAIFFDGSLKDNITMFSEISDGKIREEFDRLGLSKLMPKLHDTEFTLSGGEQRRVMLIRALLRDTPILILDEPLANLDKESIRLVEDALRRVKDKFVFVITHEPLGIPVVGTVRL